MFEASLKALGLPSRSIVLAVSSSRAAAASAYRKDNTFGVKPFLVLLTLRLGGTTDALYLTLQACFVFLSFDAFCYLLVTKTSTRLTNCTVSLWKNVLPPPVFGRMFPSKSFAVHIYPTVIVLTVSNRSILYVFWFESLWTFRKMK